jgi:ATP-dependent DNA helicase DinG
MISIIEQQPTGAAIDLVRQVQEVFSPTGILSRAKNFEYRPQQQEMAVAVAHALENREHLAVEAGTGVGKSLAYLVPAILFAIAHKKKAVVSTHTINLQEQLAQKDLPMLEAVLPVKFSFTMLKGRANYLCSRRLRKAMLQAQGLFTSSEAEELKRIYDWSKKTDDGSLSDFEIEPDPKVWSHVCSERGLCSPKICGIRLGIRQGARDLFLPARRQKILSSDVLVLNHTLFFTLLPGVDEEQESGVLFKNDFVIFDEAHTVESVASKHIGLSVSRAQVNYSLQRLWNPRTQKGLLATLRQGPAVRLVDELLHESEKFFTSVEEICDELARQQKEFIETRSRDLSPSAERRSPNQTSNRVWKELRIRRPDLVADSITLPIQRLREGVE